MLYVVKMCEHEEIWGVFDSYEKVKQYCLEMYKKFLDSIILESTRALWEEPENVISYFDQVGGVEDFCYIEFFELNKGKEFEF